MRHVERTLLGWSVARYVSEFSWATGVVRFVSEISGTRGLPTLPQNPTATGPASASSACPQYLLNTYATSALVCCWVARCYSTCISQWVPLHTLWASEVTAHSSIDITWFELYWFKAFVFLWQLKISNKWKKIQRLSYCDEKYNLDIEENTFLT